MSLGLQELLVGAIVLAALAHLLARWTGPWWNRQPASIKPRAGCASCNGCGACPAGTKGPSDAATDGRAE